jgi:hypothetical protein
MQSVLFLISKLGCYYYVQTCLIFVPMSQVVWSREVLPQVSDRSYKKYSFKLQVFNL